MQICTYVHCTLVEQEACSSEISQLLHIKRQKFKYIKYLVKDITSADTCSSSRLLVKHLLKCFTVSAMIKTNYKLFSWSKKMRTTSVLVYAVYMCPEWKHRICIHVVKAMKQPISEKVL